MTTVCERQTTAGLPKQIVNCSSVWKIAFAAYERYIRKRNTDGLCMPWTTFDTRQKMHA